MALALLKRAHFDRRRAQRRIASYERLAAIGHAVRMNKVERIGCYRVSRSIPLSDRHAGYILYALKRRAG